MKPQKNKDKGKEALLLSPLSSRNPEAFIHYEDKKAVCIKCGGIKEYVTKENQTDTHELYSYWQYKNTKKDCKHIWRKEEGKGRTPSPLKDKPEKEELKSSSGTPATIGKDKHYDSQLSNSSSESLKKLTGSDIQRKLNSLHKKALIATDMKIINEHDELAMREFIALEDHEKIVKQKVEYINKAVHLGLFAENKKLKEEVEKEKQTVKELIDAKNNYLNELNDSISKSFVKKVLDDFEQYNKQLSVVVGKQFSDDIVSAVLSALRKRLKL